MEEFKKKFCLSIKHFLQRRPISLAPNGQASASSSPSDPETAVVVADQQHHQLEPANHNPDPSGVVPAHNVEYWAEKVIGFCLSWAIAIALISLQIQRPLPLSFHFPSHAIVIALSLLFLSKYIIMYPNYRKQAKVVEHVGVLFGFTAFFFAITIPFPLCIKLIYWTVFALSRLLIFLIKNRA